MDCRALCRRDPATGEWVKAAALSNAQRIAIEKAKHSAAKKRMIEESETAKGLVTKYEALVKGHAQRDVQLGEQLKQRTAEVGRKETEAECLEVRRCNFGCVSLDRGAGLSLRLLQCACTCVWYVLWALGCVGACDQQSKCVASCCRTSSSFAYNARRIFAHSTFVYRLCPVLAQLRLVCCLHVAMPL